MLAEGYSNVQVKIVHGEHLEKAINIALENVKGTIIDIQLLDYKDAWVPEGTALITYIPDPISLADKRRMTLKEGQNGSC